MASKLKNLRSFMKVFCKDEDGATAIEYGLFAGLIAVVLVGTLTTLGTDLGDVFAEVSTKLKAVLPADVGSGT